MNKHALKELLEQVEQGNLPVEDAVDRLSDLPFRDLGFAKIDNHREIRTGYPEVIFGQGKTPEQLASIFEYMMQREGNILATRVTPAMFEAVEQVAPEAVHHQMARCITLRRSSREHPRTHIAIITAGTADLPVAEEAAVTAEIFDNQVERFFDVGVAGVHRLFNNLQAIRKAKVLVVVAGMEGALPSIVGGLVDKPVIAVPASAGYGANFGGLSALLGMLTTCASGVSVVNIDNGFGAGYLAAMINRL